MCPGGRVGVVEVRMSSKVGVAAKSVSASILATCR